MSRTLRGAGSVHRARRQVEANQRRSENEDRARTLRNVERQIRSGEVCPDCLQQFEGTHRDYCGCTIHALADDM